MIIPTIMRLHNKLTFFFKKLEYLKQNSNQSLVLIYNYHRIGKIDKKNPFHTLETTRLINFHIHMKLMSLVGKFVSLEQVTSNTNLSRLNIVITFDDVSKSVEKIIPFLIKKKIPFVLCPSSHLTNDGFGYRDKVYFINKYLEEADIYNYAIDVFGEETIGKYSDLSFYKFTKQSIVHPKLIIELLIDPLFKKIPFSSDIKNESRAYLNWNEIKDKYLNNSLVTIANHSFNHFEMTGLSKQEIEEDIRSSTQVFYDNLDTTPEYFVVPFGGLTQSLLVNLTEILRKHGYKGCLWLTNSGNIVNHQYDKQIIHLSRIHVSSVIIRLIYTTLVAIANSKAKIVDNLSKLSKKESKPISKSKCFLISSLQFDRTVNLLNSFVFVFAIILFATSFWNINIK